MSQYSYFILPKTNGLGRSGYLEAKDKKDALNKVRTVANKLDIEDYYLFLEKDLDPKEFFIKLVNYLEDNGVKIKLTEEDIFELEEINHEEVEDNV